MTYEKMSEFCLGSPYRFHMMIDEVERLDGQVQRLERQMNGLDAKISERLCLHVEGCDALRKKAEKPKTCGTCKHPWRKPNHSLICYKKNQGTGTKPSGAFRSESSPACSKHEEQL